MTRILTAIAVVAVPLTAAAVDPRILPDATDKEYRAAVPASVGGRLRALAEDPRTVFYDHRAMPPAHQNFRMAGASGVFVNTYNISANPAEPFGNGNREFPWKRPAGIPSDDTSVRSFTFFRLPAGKPVVWWREVKADYGGNSFPAIDQGGATFAWRFPDGTEFGEVLQLRDPAGGWLTFETRLRTKVDGRWAGDVFRPYTSPEELAEAARARGPIGLALARALERPTLRIMRLSDAQHVTRPVLNRIAFDEYLPPIEPGLVRSLLAVPFRAVRGVAWRVSPDGIEGWAPTADSSFHVVPRNFAGAYHPVTKAACITCHDTAGQPVDRFELGRDWYGRIRGDDAILSWHPWEPSTISLSTGSGLRPTRVRDQWVEAGILVPYRRE